MGTPTNLLDEVFKLITSHVRTTDMEIEVKAVTELVAVPRLSFLNILECSLVTNL